MGYLFGVVAHFEQQSTTHEGNRRLVEDFPDTHNVLERVSSCFLAEAVTGEREEGRRTTTQQVCNKLIN